MCINSTLYWHVLKRAKHQQKNLGVKSLQIWLWVGTLRVENLQPGQFSSSVIWDALWKLMSVPERQRALNWYREPVSVAKFVRLHPRKRIQLHNHSAQNTFLSKPRTNWLNIEYLIPCTLWPTKSTVCRTPRIPFYLLWTKILNEKLNMANCECILRR